MMGNKFINATRTAILVTMDDHEVLMSNTTFALPANVKTPPTTTTQTKKQKRIRPILTGQNYLSLRGR